MVNDTVMTTRDQCGKFTDAMKEYMFGLLDCNVSTGQVPEVIKRVLNW